MHTQMNNNMLPAPNSYEDPDPDADIEEIPRSSHAVNQFEPKMLNSRP